MNEDLLDRISVGLEGTPFQPVYGAGTALFEAISYEKCQKE
jgi:hypothetical protein